MGKPTIICVDDELYILHCLKEQLLLCFGSTYNIEIAESSREALEILGELLSEGDEVPLILSDYIMPDMKGDQLMQTIRGLNPDAVLVLLTGQATLSGVTNAVNKGGVFRYLEKPWQLENLQATVSEALDYYYQEKIIEQVNWRLREVNRQLKETFDLREADLLINQQMLDSTDRIQAIGRMATELSDLVHQLLGLISSGLDAIREWQQTHGAVVSETTRAKLELYFRSVTDYYRKTAEAFNNILDLFDRNTLEDLIYHNEKKQIDEVHHKVAMTREKIFGIVDDLLNNLKAV